MTKADDGPPTGPAFPGFSSPTYTIVPDELFDDLLSELSGAELKVLLYIIRRTFGFKKDSDNISLKQMAEGIVTRDGRVLDRGAGVAKSAAALAVKTLAEKGYIIHQRNRSHEKGDEPTTYGLRFRDGPVSRKWTGGYPENGQARVHNLDTQETVVQDTVFSNTSDQPNSRPSGLTPSKFRKASSQNREEGKVMTEGADALPSPTERHATARVSAAADPATDRGMAHIRDVLAKASIAPRPAPDGDHTQADPRGREPLAGRPRRNTRAQPVSEREAAGIRAYLGDYAPELGDKAPFKSSMTRVTNLYVESGLTVATFTTRMDSARRRTKATPNLRNKFSYFLALLEEECGLREPPPERADAARQRGVATPVEEESDTVPAERQSLAGRYRHLVKR